MNDGAQAVLAVIAAAAFAWMGFRLFGATAATYLIRRAARTTGWFASFQYEEVSKTRSTTGTRARQWIEEACRLGFVEIGSVRPMPRGPVVHLMADADGTSVLWLTERPQAMGIDSVCEDGGAVETMIRGEVAGVATPDLVIDVVPTTIAFALERHRQRVTAFAREHGGPIPQRNLARWLDLDRQHRQRFAVEHVDSMARRLRECRARALGEAAIAGAVAMVPVTAILAA